MQVVFSVTLPLHSPVPFTWCCDRLNFSVRHKPRMKTNRLARAFSENAYPLRLVSRKPFQLHTNTQ